MTTSLIFVQLFILIFTSSESKATVSENVRKLTEYFNQLIQDLGYKTLSDEFYKFSKESSPEVNSDLIKQLSEAVESKFNTAKEALLRLRDATESYHKNLGRNNPDAVKESSQEFRGCCDVDASINNFHQRSENFDYVGCHLSNFGDGQSALSSSKNFSKRVFDVMKSNLETTKDLKWQYFATVNGSFYLYPARKLESCITFDPRKRSWYSESSTLHAKDVVIAIDVSGSMEMTNIQGRSLLDIVKIGANMVVNTLNTNDRIAVVAFSNTVEMPVDFDCYKRELAVATPQNKQCINKFINSLRGKSLTNYMDGLARAFRYFNTAPNISDDHRDRILLFLSDGMPTVGGGWENISKLIETNCSQKDITLMAYGIGKALQDPQNRDLLTNMAKYCPGEKPHHEYLTEITSPSDMQNSIANYYVGLHLYKDREEPIFTLPYLDAGGLGFIMSMCLPVQTAGKFLGVVCTDIPISDLLDDVINFHQGELSYAFLINKLGQTYFHPLLPTPSSLNEIIGLTDIEALERDPTVREIIQSMKNGEKNGKELETQRTFSRGSTTTEGIEILWANTLYLWTPINGYNFSVCIVIAADEKTVKYSQVPPSSSAFVYHDFRKQQLFHRHSFKHGICTRNRKIIHVKVGGVTFALSLYKNSNEYRNGNESEKDIIDIQNYMEDETNSSTLLKENVRNSVRFTALAEDIWKEKKNVFIWKYIATISGVFRIFPAVRLNKLFDARKRQWFHRAVNNKGSLIFTAPYLDVAGTGYVISIARAICRGDCQRYNIMTPVAAVLGSDINLYYLHEKLIEMEPKCNQKNKCILVDSSGYLVMHDSFIYPSKASAPPLESVHLSVKEPNITKTLLRDGILRVKACLDILTIKNKYYWQMQSHERRIFHDFTLHPILGTNIFFIIKAVDYDFHSPRSCNIVSELIGEMVNNGHVNPDFVTCEKKISNGEISDCSCSSPANSDPCPNSFDYKQLSDLWPTCVPGTERVDVLSVEDADYSQFAPCKTDCSQRTNRSECYKTEGCMWCIMSRKGENLVQPFCSLKSDCYFGIIGSIGPYEFSSTRIQELPVKDQTLLVTLSSTATILSFIVIVIACVILYKRKKIARKLKEDKSQLLGCTLRTSIVEMEKDNPSMVWGNMVENSSTTSTSPSKERISLQKFQRPHSSSSDSIAYLTQKVEALVHRLDSVQGSPLHVNEASFQSQCCSSRQRYNCNRLSSNPSEYSTLPRSTSFTSALSSRSSTLDSFRFDNVLRHRCNSSTMPRPSSHLAAFPEEQILNPMQLLSSPVASVPTERTCSTCLLRTPSERTWPGQACNSAIIDVANPNVSTHLLFPKIRREPSERSYYPDEHSEWQDVKPPSTCNVCRTSSLPSTSRRPSFLDSSFLRHKSVLRRRRRNSHSNRSSASSQSSAAAAISNLIEQSLLAVAAEQNESLKMEQNSKEHQNENVNENIEGHKLNEREQQQVEADLNESET